MVRTSQDGTELGLLREGQISFLGEGGGGWWGGFKKKVVWDWGGEKDYEAASPADPNGEGRVSPSRGIWHNPPESMESLCVVLILFNHTSELRNKKGKEKQPPGEHLPCVQVRTDALYGFAPLIPQHTTKALDRPTSSNEHMAHESGVTASLAAVCSGTRPQTWQLPSP